LRLLKQHDISPAQFDQVVGNAATYYTAANDHNLRLGWEELYV
jgi:hypothetical protein